MKLLSQKEREQNLRFEELLALWLGGIASQKDAEELETIFRDQPQAIHRYREQVGLCVDLGMYPTSRAYRARSAWGTFHRAATIAAVSAIALTAGVSAYRAAVRPENHDVSMTIGRNRLPSTATDNGQASPVAATARESQSVPKSSLTALSPASKATAAQNIARPRQEQPAQSQKSRAEGTTTEEGEDDMKKTIGAMALAGSVLTAQAAVTTNVWKWTVGGDWNAATNWSLGTVPSSTQIADLAALASGETVSQGTTGLNAGGFRFTGSPDAVWTLGVKNNSTLTFSYPTGANLSDFYVGGGTLNLNAYLAFGGAIKNGDGVLRCTYGRPLTDTHDGGLRVADGTLELAEDGNFQGYLLRLATNSTLKISTDTRIGGLSSIGTLSHPVDLSGHCVTLGRYKTPQSFDGILAGTGTLQVVNTWTLLQPPTFSGEVQLLNGHLRIPLLSAFPSSATVAALGGGTLDLGGAQTLALISGTGISGGIALTNGASLTVTGTGSATSTVFSAEISGNGSFVKDGAEYLLTLDGHSSYTGATHVVAGGLRLAPPFSRKGLVAFYRFSDPFPLGHDSSVNNLDLAVSNGVSSANGRMGGGALFTAANQSGFCASDLTAYPADFPFSNSAYTVSFWIRPSTNCADNAPLFQWGVHTDRGDVFLRLDGQKGVMLSNCVQGGNVNNYLTTATIFRDGNWHHLVLVYNQTNSVFYCDNVKIATIAQNHFAIRKDGALRIGLPINMPGYNSTSYYDGLMDEFQIYNRAWSADEVAAEYTLNRPEIPASEMLATLPEPVAYYAFDDAAAPGKDSGPYHYDLAASGTVAVATSDAISGGALDLRSAYGYLTLGEGMSFPAQIPSGTNAVTVSCWVRPDVLEDSQYCAVGWGIPASSSVHFIQYVSCSLWYTLDAGGNWIVSQIPSPDTSATESRWHHVVAVHDPNSASQKERLYVDGSLRGTCNVRMNVAAANFFIGRKVSSPTAWFKGMIDEVRIYDQVLSDGRIRLLGQLRGPAYAASGIPPVLPATTILTVDPCATARVEMASQRVAGLTGTGLLALDSSRFTVTGVSAFGGTLAGSSNSVLGVDGGTLTLAANAATGFVGTACVSNGTLRLNGAWGGGLISLGSGGRVEGLDSGAATAGAVTLADGIVISMGAGGAGLPAANAAGTVTIPANGTVDWTAAGKKIPAGNFVIAKGSPLSAPGGIAGWKVSPAISGSTARFKLQGNTLILKVSRNGTVIRLM